MISLVFLTVLVFLVAFSMTMVGKGGGNFYVAILTWAGIPMHQAATTGQFILCAASVAAMAVFHRNKSLSWRLAATLGALMAISAFCGGYFAHLFSDFFLQLFFAAMLVLAGALMLSPTKHSTPKSPTHTFGILAFQAGGRTYSLNLLVVVPFTIMTGLASGMVGVSGGSFLMPLMVLACGVPIQIAAGTAAPLIAVSALMGFAGHALQGDFDPHFAVPLAMVTILGGLLGGKFALDTKPKGLKNLFAYTNWLAALMMIISALHTQ